MVEIIRTEHVARLLSGEGGSVLVIHDGRADVVSEEALEEPRYKGAMRLIGREDLGADQDADHMSLEDLESMARRLNSAVESLGG